MQRFPPLGRYECSLRHMGACISLALVRFFIFLIDMAFKSTSRSVRESLSACSCFPVLPILCLLQLSCIPPACFTDDSMNQGNIAGDSNIWKHISPFVTDPPGLEGAIKLLKPSRNFCEVLQVNMGETKKPVFHWWNKQTRTEIYD